jgi:outer membrane biogenesis lipoprotein LolB
MAATASASLLLKGRMLTTSWPARTDKQQQQQHQHQHQHKNKSENEKKQSKRVRAI